MLNRERKFRKPTWIFFVNKTKGSTSKQWLPFLFVTI